MVLRREVDFRGLAAGAGVKSSSLSSAGLAVVLAISSSSEDSTIWRRVATRRVGRVDMMAVVWYQNHEQNKTTKSIRQVVKGLLLQNLKRR
jgi:hypothetical protein